MYTALITEDSKPILRNIKALLQSTDLPISIAATASNGEEALEYMRQHPVDILLTDIRMPKMDGLALIEQAKHIYPQLKVVLISGYNDFEYTRKALNLQVFDYLLKPVERHQLLEVMERIIVQLNEGQVSDTEIFKEILDPHFRLELKLGPDFHNLAKIPFILCKQPFTPGLVKWEREFLQARLSEAFAPYDCWVLP
ncbi:response regulator [Paenibacillus prosopidis]|uniref:Response regulator receiver domain-containing protein n=1 Tax=Paenibacillus prosopidis TaxID=630520 RepID=A0A368VNA5_9BACL|nr:response regulator [Paenibacillus prosopidis]RCW43000.1 response regulator receiver domain-containing protein [Paenibacillus prosopidis]